jgi:lipase maturation factor 1
MRAERRWARPACYSRPNATGGLSFSQVEPEVPQLSAEPRRMPGHVVTRRLLLRLVGAVYFVAFASLAVQITGLVGERGLLPAERFLEWAHSIYGGEAYRQLPTIFWLGASDGALKLAAWGGAVLSLLLILGVAPLATLLVLWALYLSLVVAGQDFLSFQWDALLLETGLMAIVWAPATLLLGRNERAPSELARFLVVFLLFKLMFLSGATKVLSGDPTWRNLTALGYHFETQPLPPWTAWYAHRLPGGAHRALTALTLLGELVVPWLLLLPARFRTVRIGTAAALVLLQVGIEATGNFGFFNLLTIVLCVAVLDDGALARLRVRRGDGDLEPESRPRRVFMRIAVPVLLALSTLSLVRELAYTIPNGRGMGLLPGWGERVLGWVAPLRSINGYGLFRVMTTYRPELVVEGSRDGTRWEAYGFRYKPGDLDRRPRLVAPFHPRLDWQLWFAALSPMQNYQWLETLGERLRAGTPEVVGLLGRNPFERAPPRYVRAALYDYRFTTAEERRRTDAWWVRELEGTIPLGPQP